MKAYYEIIGECPTCDSGAGDEELAEICRNKRRYNKLAIARASLLPGQKIKVVLIQ